MLVQTMSCWSPWLDGHDKCVEESIDVTNSKNNQVNAPMIVQHVYTWLHCLLHKNKLKKNDFLNMHINNEFFNLFGVK
jgi:hypothetical protein